MTLTENVQEAIKSKKIIIGYKKSVKFIKLNSPKIIVIAKNIPEKMRGEIEHSSKISDVKVEIFDGTSKELGILCGKEFPISTLVIKG
jgi:large subunit ribosomal protein L30e